MFSDEDFPPLPGALPQPSETPKTLTGSSQMLSSKPTQRDLEIQPPQKIQKVESSPQPVQPVQPVQPPQSSQQLSQSFQSQQPPRKTKLNIVRPNAQIKTAPPPPPPPLPTNKPEEVSKGELPETYVVNGLYYSAKTNLPLWPQPAPKLPEPPKDSNAPSEAPDSANSNPADDDGKEENKKKKKKRKRTRKRNKDPVRVTDDGVFSLNVGRLVVNKVKDNKRRMRIREMQSLMSAKTATTTPVGAKKKKGSNRVGGSSVSFVEDDESIGSVKSVVLIGRYKDTATRGNRELRILVNNHKRSKTKKLTKLKKSIYRNRLQMLINKNIKSKGDTLSSSSNTSTNTSKKTLSESEAALILNKINKKPIVPEPVSTTEKGEGEGEGDENNDENLVCKWAMCGDEFPNTKEGLAKFKAHLEAHAKADQEDMMCLWEGCQHPMFVKLRTLRLHAQRHAKLNRPKPPPVWTRDVVRDLKKAPHGEPADVAALFPQLPAGPEVEECVAALLPPLGVFQSRAKAKKATTAAEAAAAFRRQRYVIGLRETMREVRGGTAKLVVLAHKVENVDVKGGPLDLVGKIVQYGKEKNTPVVVAHSRKKLSGLLKARIKGENGEKNGKRKGFNFGVSAIAVTSVDGADKEYKRMIELLKEKFNFN